MMADSNCASIAISASLGSLTNERMSARLTKKPMTSSFTASLGRLEPVKYQPKLNDARIPRARAKKAAARWVERIGERKMAAVEKTMVQKLRMVRAEK